MPRRHRGHPGETEPPENADHEGPAPADLLQMWITGRQPQTAATPETPPEPEPSATRPSTPATPVADRTPRSMPDRDGRRTPVEDEPLDHDESTRRRGR